MQWRKVLLLEKTSSEPFRNCITEGRRFSLAVKLSATVLLEVGGFL
jgi:hypothetical protein